jgi:hypothetical protein
MQKNLPGRSYRKKAFTQKKLQVKIGITDTKLQVKRRTYCDEIFANERKIKL